MFSLSDTPVQLDGISFAEMGPGGVFSQLNSEVADFSKVLGELQQSGGEISLQQLSENPEMLKDLGLSSDHLKMLQQLLADGKSLPEAAQNLLFDLKQQLAELLRHEPSLEQVEQIEALQEEVVELLELLPENLRADIEAELQVLHQITYQLRQELETQPKEAPTEDGKKIVEDTSTTENSETSEDPEKLITVDTMQNDEQNAENASLAAAAVTVNHGQQGSKKPDHAGQNSAAVAMQSSVNKQTYANSAAVQGTEYGQTEAEYELPSEGKSQVENRVMPSLPGQQGNGRVAQLQINEQAMTQAMAKFSGQGAGSNLQSGGNNASYTQLMTQSMPSPVSQNIHKPEWGNAIGQRITWMIGKQLQGAQLRISPAHLGPVDIKLSIESGVANVNFVSNHQVVRDALEQAVPRLRDMLENQNLELGDVDISDRNLADSSSMQDNIAHSQAAGVSSDGEARQESDGDDDQAMVHVLQSDALLDAYA